MKKPYTLRTTWGSLLATLALVVVVSWSALTQEKADSQETVSLLVKQLKSQVWKTRQEAIQGLRTNRSTSREVVSALIESLADVNERDRFQIGSTLGAIASQVSDVIPTIEQALKHPKAEVREYAAFAFTYLATQPSGKAAVPALLELLKDRDARVRGRAIQALERLDPTNAGIVPLFIAALKDDDSRVRLFAAGALGSTGSKTPQVVDALTLALRDEKPEVRMVAADVLERMAPSVKGVVPGLEEAQFNYTTNSGTLTVTGYLGSGGVVAIPDTVNGLPVTRIGNAAFRGCSSVTTITIPHSVTGIGDDAFSGCSSLSAILVEAANSLYNSMDGVLFNKNHTTLIHFPGGKAGGYTIPSSVTRIGETAFAGCTSLTNLTLPGSVTSIGNNAFSGCIGLTRVTIPNTVSNLGDGAFAYCTSLNDVTISSGVTGIGNDAFSGCTALTGVTIPQSVTSIGDSAFFYCTNLASLAIPNSVTNIGGSALHFCTGLSSVRIPNSVTAIGDGAFGGCTRLSEIAVEALNSFYSSVGGVLFDKSQTLLLQCPGGKAGDYAIPNSVTRIGAGAFSYCTGLTSVTISDSVTNVAAGAFGGCTSLSAITVRPLNSFYSTVNGVLFDKNQTTLTHCPGGKAGSYTIPNSVTRIGRAAFAGSSRLINVTLPGSVSRIGGTAFFDCSSLTGVYFQGDAPTPEDVGGDVFVLCDRATVYYLPGTTGWSATFGGRSTALVSRLPAPEK